MPQTTAISTSDKEAYTLFIRFLRSSMPQLSADISSGLTAKMANAVQKAVWQTRTMVPISKVQCTCSIITTDDFAPIIDTSFQILYQNYPTEFKLSDQIPVRNTVALSIFREADWEKILLVLKNDVHAAFRKIADNMPLFVLPIGSLPSNLKDLYQHKVRKVGNVTAVCTRELVSKYAFYTDDNNCIRVTNWRDNAISLAPKQFQPEEKAWRSKIRPEDKGKLIADPLSFLGFCSLASQVLSKSFPSEAAKIKPAFFRFQGGRFHIQAENNKSHDISDLFLSKNKYKKSVRGRLEDLLRRFLSGEICPTAEQSALEEFFDQLNETELFLLKYCTRNSPQKLSLFLTDIVRDTENCEQIEKAVDRLCFISVPQGGGYFPILRRQENGAEYQSDVCFQCSMLHKRPLPRLSLPALDELGEAALKFYFVEKSANPFDAENCWDALCALERMPAESIRGYSKTKAGEVFFKSFTDDDAIYANYILESVTENDAS